MKELKERDRTDCLPTSSCQRETVENVKSAGRAHVRLLCYVLLVQLLRTPIEMEVCVCVCVCVCVKIPFPVFFSCCEAYMGGVCVCGGGGVCMCVCVCV